MYLRNLTRVPTIQKFSVNEDQLDEIMKSAALICDCKISLISLIGSECVCFKSKYGIDASEAPRDISFCGHTIMSDDLFIIEDAQLDERFCDNPLFLGEPHIRFYAGAPLIAPNGQRIGTLCVVDSESKKLDKKQKNLLKTLSKQIINFFELRKQKKEYQEQCLVLEAYKKGLEAQAIIARTDRDGIITYVNDEFCKISKYSKEEIIGQDHRLLNSGFHEKVFFKNMWDTITKGKVWRGNIRNKAKDGSLYWVDTVITSIKDEKGEIREYMAFRYDITSKKENEYLLEETQRNAHIGGWELDIKTQIPKWTDETYRIHEIEIGTPTNLLDAISFYAEHERERISNYVKDCIEKGVPYDSTFEFLSAKGKKKWVYVKGFPEIDKEGNIQRILGTFQDITEQKKLEASLIKSNDNLKESVSEQKVISQILSISTDLALDMNSKFKGALNTLFELPWLKILTKGMMDPKI